MKTDFDSEIGKINVVTQDIGRVILNLLTNAFYAVTEKKKSNIDGYEPVVSISTRKLGQKVEIKVRDNGNGIPMRVLDKIFQPFFTTKPTGEGTGLGLSLSYFRSFSFLYNYSFFRTVARYSYIGALAVDILHR